MEKKVVIYTRVSTEEQKINGFSLQDQEQRLRDYCIRKNYLILKHYEEDYSAKTFNRPKFNEFLKDINTKQIKPEIILCVRPDRFSRHLENSLKMRTQLKELKIAVEFIEQNIDTSIPENKIMEVLSYLYPQIENERRGLNTKQGMRQALREGRWVWKAPIGYKNDKDSKTIIPDEKTSFLMIEAFELIGKGIYAAEEVRKALVKRGLKCSKNNFLNILKNPIYMGKILIKEWKDAPEEIVQGIHAPLISSELFERVQSVLNGKRKKIFINVSRSELFPLRPFLQCRVCGNKLTGSESKGRNGKKHAYYHCQNGCKERFRTEIAHNVFISYISSFKAPIEILTLYYAVLKDVFLKDDIQRITERKAIDGQIEKNKERLRSIEDKYVDGEVDMPSFNSIKKRLQEEEQLLLAKHLTLGNVFNSYDKHIKYSFSLLEDLPNYYFNSTLDVKHEIIGSIFPEKLIFDENKYRTTRTNEVLALLFNNNNNVEVLKKQKPPELDDFSIFAPPPGLEPGTP